MSFITGEQAGYKNMQFSFCPCRDGVMNGAFAGGRVDFHIFIV